MKKKLLRAAMGKASCGLICVMTFVLAGCNSVQPEAPANAKPATGVAAAADEARQVAEASLGRQAEVLAHGDLARNGLEQVLAVNRFSKGAPAVEGSKDASTIFVTRAAVLEKVGGKWSQVLLCDEQLKNPKGYLTGSRPGLVNGWRLEYRRDAKDGLEMKFTPAEGSDPANANTDRSSEQQFPSFDVRWNKNAKRYQSFDQSQERYLSEIPSLETPQSILK